MNAAGSSTQIQEIFSSNGTYQFVSSGSERFRIDSAGNVGIGTSSPSTYKDSQGTIFVTGSSPNWATIQSRGDGPSGAGNYVSYGGSYSTNPINGARIGLAASGGAGQQGQILFYTKVLDDNTTQPLERMRIDPSGSVRINNTANATFAAQLNTQFTTAQNCGLYLKVTNTSGAQGMIIFGNTTNDAVGSISTTGSSTAYLTSSDYRLKTDAQPMTGASGRVLALNPVNFKWISSGERVDGFLAHEAAEVVPEAVSGEKDAMRDEEYEVTPAVEATYDEEGNELTPAVEAVMGTRTMPDYQGIDQSKLVPLLTAALQEALAQIEEQKTALDVLTARVSALEGN